MNKPKLFNYLFNKTLENRQYYPRRWRTGKFSNQRRYNFNRGSFYNLSQRPMTMGPGSTRLRITYDTVMSGTGNESFTNAFGNNNELINQFVLYKYFRVFSVNIVVFANNLTNVPSYMTVDWDGKLLNNNRLYRHDSVKMVPGFLTRTKVFSFIPPNTSITFNNGNRQTINYTEWSSTDSIRNSSDTFVFPSYFLFDVPSDISLPVRYELIVDMRGNQIFEPAAKKVQLQIIPEDKKEEDIPKPLFYNSNKPEITLRSQSAPKENIFSNKMLSNLQGTLQNNMPSNLQATLQNKAIFG